VKGVEAEAEAEYEEALDDDREYDGEYGEEEYEQVYTMYQESQAALEEAETLAQEAVAALEAEQASKRQAEALVTQLQRELDWAAKKAAKERTEWESRMKDSFKYVRIFWWFLHKSRRRVLSAHCHNFYFFKLPRAGRWRALCF